MNQIVQTSYIYYISRSGWTSCPQSLVPT